MNLYDLLWWSNGIYCMHCKSKNISFIKKERLNLYSCVDCGKKFTVFSTTPFERTKLTEEQWTIILSELTSETKPFLLAKKVGIHHWSMSKIMTKIRKHMRRGLPAFFDVKSFRECTEKLSTSFNLTGDYAQALGVILAFLYCTKVPAIICEITGVPIDFVNKCFDNIKKSWISGMEFFDCGKKYADYENMDELEVVTHLYVLCLLGEIIRNPETGMFSCPVAPQEVSPPQLHPKVSL